MYPDPLVCRRADPQAQPDPSRHARIQAFGPHPDGIPDFGVPVVDTVKESA
uniref:hypothetical protein n=1 Tax=Streptomyces asoensis TaxID=249586 RepID=UPI0034603A1B